MRARARVRRIEDVPDWMKCCPRGAAAIAACAGDEMVVRTPAHRQTANHCGYCGAETRDKWAMVILVQPPGKQFDFVYADFVDLDEGGEPCA